MKPKILVIVGPTASGKSSLAVELAKKFHGEILCVDSRTVYRGMDVGTAKDVGFGVWGLGNPPSLGLRWAREAPFLKNNKNQSLNPKPQSLNPTHHGLDLVNPNEQMNGALFKEYADKVITDILSRGHLPILCGGTGLWLDMIVDNLEMPEVEPDLLLRAELEKRSEEDLFAEFAGLDPVGAEVIDRKNKRRLVRALEVCKKTGRPFSEFQKRGEQKYDALWLGIDWPKEILDERINARVDEMINVRANGRSPLLDEVKQLKEKYGCDSYAMSGIGYREICEHFRKGERLFAHDTVVEIADEIKKNTRQYAKRQRTWFKRNKNIHWIMDVSITESIVQMFIQ